jgi:hypothetical protein
VFGLFTDYEVFQVLPEVVKISLGSDPVAPQADARDAFASIFFLQNVNGYSVKVTKSK